MRLPLLGYLDVRSLTRKQRGCFRNLNLMKTHMLVTSSSFCIIVFFFLNCAQLWKYFCAFVRQFCHSFFHFVSKVELVFTVDHFPSLNDLRGSLQMHLFTSTPSGPQRTYTLALDCTKTFPLSASVAEITEDE